MMILATAAARPGLQLGLAAIAGAACLMTVAAGAGERPATPQRPCTMIGCDDGLKVELRSAGPWPAGEYRFAIRLDGVPIECSGTLPLKECAARSVTCDREGMVQVVESGCALPAVAQSFPELRLEPRLRPRKVEISVTRDGERVGGADIAADFRKVHPNGQECPPACEAARAALDLDFRQR